VWDWFCLDGQEVLFITAIGILKHAEPRIMGATLHSDLHTIVRELGTDLHDDDAFMDFLYAMAPPSEIEQRQAGQLFDKVWDCDEESSGDSSSHTSSGYVDHDIEQEDAAQDDEPLETGEDDVRASKRKEHPPAAWATTDTAKGPVKSSRRRKPSVPTKLHNMLHHFIESHRKTADASIYRKQFTMQDIETLRSIYRPQFEKKPEALL
jgi:hypothetical protein